MAGQQPEEQVRVPVARQGWRDLTFLHWAYDPDVVAALLPDGVVPDLWEGRAWVGMTPFVLHSFRLPFAPPLPGLSTFPETNLRTYVRGPDGRDGLWFLSLEAESLPTTIVARVGFGVPYRWARMEVRSDGGTVEYLSTRRSTPPVGHRIVVRPRPAGDWRPGAREHWLTGRWRAWTRVAGRLATVAVRHEPWPLQPADLVELDEGLVAAAGLPAPGGPPLVHFSAGVDDVRLGPPRPVRDGQAKPGGTA